MQRRLTFLGTPDDPYSRDEVREALLDLEGTLFQIGGAITVAAVRTQIGSEYHTVGMVVTYDSFSPAVKSQETEEWTDLPGEEEAVATG